MSNVSPVRSIPTGPPATEVEVPLTQVWFTTREAATYTRKGLRTIYRVVHEGALVSDQGNTPGAHHRFHRDELDRWLREGRAPARPLRHTA